MIKDAPAFDFYPERWLAGVASFSDAEQLSYLRLLCHQWLTGDAGLPDDAAQLRRLAGRGVTPALLEKFPVSAEDGRRRNAKLEALRAEQRVRIAKRREGALKTNQRRWGSRSDAAAPSTAPSRAQPLPDAAAAQECAEPRPKRATSRRAGVAERPGGESPPPTTHPSPSTAEQSHGWLGTAQPQRQPGRDSASGQGQGTQAAEARQQPPAPSNSNSNSLTKPAADDATRPQGLLRNAPPLWQITQWAEEKQLPPQCAQIFWNDHQARHWRDRFGQEIHDVRAAFHAYALRWQSTEERLQKTATSTARNDAANLPGRYGRRSSTAAHAAHA